MIQSQVSENDWGALLRGALTTLQCLVIYTGYAVFGAKFAEHGDECCNGVASGIGCHGRSFENW